MESTLDTQNEVAASSEIINDSDKDSNPYQVPQGECIVLYTLCRGRVVKMGRSLTTARKPGARASGFQTSLWGSLSSLLSKRV